MFTKLLDFLFQPFIVKTPKSPANIPLFDPDCNFGNMYPKLAVFYHSTLYSKLVEILDTVYGGYNSDYSTYLPPSGNREAQLYMCKE